MNWDNLSRDKRDTLSGTTGQDNPHPLGWVVPCRRFCGPGMKPVLVNAEGAA